MTQEIKYKWGFMKYWQVLLYFIKVKFIFNNDRQNILQSAEVKLAGSIAGFTHYGRLYF